MESPPIIATCVSTSGGSDKYVLMEETVIRADLAQIKLGSYVILMPNSVIRPPISLTANAIYLPVFIGNHVFIGRDSVVQANDIGNHVYIGNNCVIGPRCKLRDNCRITDGTVLPADTTVPPFTMFSGNPGRLGHELPESTEENMKHITVEYYQRYASLNL